MTSPGGSGASQWQGIRTVVSLAADLLALGLAVAAVSGFFFSAPVRLVGFLLIAVAIAGAVAVFLPVQRPWIRQTLMAGLILTVAIGGGVVVYHNPTPATARFTVPRMADVIPTCRVELRFDGKPGRGRTFVVATRQGANLYYFEAAVQRDPSGGDQAWQAQVQAGSRSRGLNERFDLFVFAMDEDLAHYLSTVRQDQVPTNTFWPAPELPPGVNAPAAETFIKRAPTADPTCPE